MAAIQERGLVRKCETVWVSDYHYAFPNFRLYDPVNCTWTFEWDKWIDSVKKKDHPKAIHDPSDYFVEADKADLLILTELELNARARFSEISKAMGITLQAVKHRYDKRILPRGLIRDFIINLAVHPPELADMYEVLLSFEDGESMNSFFGASEEMFPILRTVKVLGETKLGIRTYSPHNETGELFGMLSKLARSGLVCDYSAVRIRPETQARQSISAELFEDKLGWKYDLSRDLATLDASVEHAKVRSG
jgi:DNA-binding Lrp family transcriptional regulator